MFKSERERERERDKERERDRSRERARSHCYAQEALTPSATHNAAEKGEYLLKNDRKVNDNYIYIYIYGWLI